MNDYWPGEIDRSRLLRSIIQSFSEADLRTLCFELGLEYDDLPPGGRSDADCSG
jgi:hypothetical protein